MLLFGFGHDGLGGHREAATADDEQLRDCEPRGPVDEGTLIRIAGKLPTRLQFLEQGPCFGGQALYRTSGRRAAFEAVYGQHGR